MKLDYNKLIELLNVFGLSMKVEKGNITFIDKETNMPMKSCVTYIGDIPDHIEYTEKASLLLNGLPFFVLSENKSFRLKIFVNDGNIKLYEISKTETKAPHLYERSEMYFSKYERLYFLNESTYRVPTNKDGSEPLALCDFISNVNLRAYESNDDSGIEVEIDNKIAGIYFKKDATTGEIIRYIGDEDFIEISQQETIQLIEQSGLFKETMRILCPTLAEGYSNAKTNIAGQKK